MRWVQHNRMHYLQFPALAGLPDFFHGVFPRTADPRATRIGGFNVGIDCGQPETVVKRNREHLLACFGGPVGVFALQVHGTDIGIVSSAEAPTGRGNVRLNGDALATALPNHALIIQIADCQPVLIADPCRRVAANIHSGWRGSVGNVIGRTIETLVAEFGCRPQDLIAGIGPSLGPCCAEFINYREEIPRKYWRYRREGDLFDFWRLSTDQLIQAGVPAHAISVAGMCTRCNQHLFFSYRGRRQTGRFAAVIGLR